MKKRILILLSSLCFNCQAGDPDYDRAARYATRAYIKYSNADLILENIKEKYISEKVEERLGIAVILTAVLVEKRISYTWEF